LPLSLHLSQPLIQSEFILPTKEQWCACGTSVNGQVGRTWDE